MMIQKVPILLECVLDIWLDHDQFSIGPEDPMNLLESLKQRILAGQMLEEIAAKDHVDGAVCNHGHVGAICSEGRDIWVGKCLRSWAQVYCEFRGAVNMVDELTISSTQIQDGVFLMNELLQKDLT